MRGVRAKASSSKAAKREKRGRQPEKPFHSRAFSHARGHFRVSRLSLDGLRKKRNWSSCLKKLAILSLYPRSHVRILIHQSWAIKYSKVARETGSTLCRIAPWDCFGDAVASSIGWLRIHPPPPPKESHSAIRHNKAQD